MSKHTPGAKDQIVITEDADVSPQSKAEKEKALAAQEFSQLNADTRPSMQVRIASPFRDYFDGQAFSISAENKTGPFDILPSHHNFISLLKDCEVVVRTTSGEERKILIAGGLIHVKADRTIVFLDI